MGGARETSLPLPGTRVYTRVCMRLVTSDLRASQPGAPTEIVRRPDPGLARGVWEGPTWLFPLVAAVAVLAAVGLALHRAGLLRRFRRRKDEPVRSSRRPGALR